MWPTVIGILYTLVDTYQSRALLLVRVESPIPPHTAVLLGSVESRCPRRFFVDGGVRFSYRCSRDKKQNNRRLNQLPVLTEHDNRRLNLCLGGWSRLDSSTQRLCWVAWSPRRLHLLPTVIEIRDTLVDIYQSGALLLVRVESPISQHTAVLLGGVESRCPRRFLWTGV